MTDLPALFRLLARHHVEYILVGGVAATVHGSSRLTQDLDLVYRRTPENMGRLAEGLAAHSPHLRDAPHGLPFRLDQETLARGLNFTLTTDLGDLDLFGEIIGGGGYEELLPHAIALHVFDVTCLCLDLDHLIQVKRAAGRPRDLEVVAELEALREEKDKKGG